MIKVLIVEDHESMRQSLSTMFARTGEFEVIGGIPSAAFAEDYCKSYSPNWLLWISALRAAPPACWPQR